MTTQAIPTAAAPAAPHRAARARRWTGRGLTGLTALFLAVDGAVKFFPDRLPPEAIGQIGWTAAQVPTLGVLLLGSLALYLARPTAVLGAVLLTGYLGGAVATHLRVDNPLLSHTLFPVYVGLLAWAGLWLRDDRLRALFPLRSSDR